MMRLPTYEQSLSYFDEYVVPTNIKEHCMRVEQVATCLAKHLKKKQPELNVELVTIGALLHDLFKVVVIKELKPTKYHKHVPTSQELAMHKTLREKYPDMYEGDVAYEVFKDEFPELARFLQRCSDPQNFDKTTEEMLVHYADCRVLATNIVSVQRRLDYLHEVYPENKHLYDKEYEYNFAFEEKLFKQLNFTPEQLEQVMQDGQ